MGTYDCKQRIQEKCSDRNATKVEQKIAKYLLDNFEASLHSTLLELADDIGVSDASVVRFCKGIGYKGFQEFKINAALECVPVAKLYNPGLEPSDSTEEICRKTFSAEVSTLTRTIDALDIQMVERVAALLLKAPRIVMVGTGGSMIIARDAQHKFLKIGIQVLTHEDKDIQLMEASLLGKDDVLFAISQSGNNLHVVGIEKIARQNGATVVALASHGKNQVSEHADYTLSTMGEKTIFESEGVSTRVAQLAVIDCLVAVIAFENYDRSLEAIRKTREATSGNKL